MIKGYGSEISLANLKESFGAEVRWGKVVYLCHTCDSNSYPLRCLYILTLGLQGHNLKGYPVENAKKETKQKSWLWTTGRMSSGVKIGRTWGKERQHKMNLQGENTKTQPLGQHKSGVLTMGCNGTVWIQIPSNSKIISRPTIFTKAHLICPSSSITDPTVRTCWR